MISTASSPTASRCTCAPIRPCFARDGIELDKSDYYARYLGYDDVGLFEALAKDRGIALTAGKIDEWVAAKSHIVEEMLSSDSVLFPGAAACVKMFAERVPLAVASGALEPEIEIVLEHAGLRSCFAAIASAPTACAASRRRILSARDREAARSTAAVLRPRVVHRDRGLALGTRGGPPCRTAVRGVTHTYPAAELGEADLIVDQLSDLTLSRIEDLLRDNGAAR